MSLSVYLSVSVCLSVSLFVRCFSSLNDLQTKSSTCVYVIVAACFTLFCEPLPTTCLCPTYPIFRRFRHRCKEIETLVCMHGILYGPGQHFVPTNRQK